MSHSTRLAGVGGTCLGWAWKGLAEVEEVVKVVGLLLEKVMWL